MSDQGEKTCPLCAEEMDLTDQQLKPCKCGYEICVWCWHHIMDMAEKDETDGRCPACRTPYNKEKIVGMAPTCEKIVAEMNMEKKLKSHKGKSKTSESRKQLCSVRVIQRNLVYIVGLPLNLADEDLLQNNDYFAQYGKVSKVSISRTAAGAIQHFPNNTCSVYITYMKEEEAVRCIQSVHGFVLDGRPLKACFGTTKYCHAWLRNVPCTNPDCLYLHEIGSQEDSFTKDEIISAYTRSRVQQISGATNIMQRRSGSILPPPADNYCNNSFASTAKPISKGTTTNSATSTRVSPPNSSSGRSAALPAGASWGTRASNNQPPPATSLPHSNKTLKSKPEMCNSAATFSAAVASTSQCSSLHADRDKQPSHVDESSNNQDRRKIETPEPARQYVEADDHDYVTETPPTPVLHCGSSTNGQIHSHPAAKEKDRHMTKETNNASSFDRALMPDGPDTAKVLAEAADYELGQLCSDMSSLSNDRHQNVDQSSNPLTSVGKAATCAAYESCMTNEKSNSRLDLQMQVVTRGNGDGSHSSDDLKSRIRDAIPDRGHTPSESFNFSTQSPFLTNTIGSVGANMHIVDRNSDSLLQPSSFQGTSNGYQEKNIVNCYADVGSTNRGSSSLPNADQRKYGNSFEGETTTADCNGVVDMGESSIISNILSLDFDPWDAPLTSPQNLANLLGDSDKQPNLRLSNSLKLHTSNQSRFSFAREEKPINQAPGFEPSLTHTQQVFNHSLSHDYSNSRSFQLDNPGPRNGFSLINNEDYNSFPSNYSTFSSNKLSVSRSQMSAPPGFSAPNRAPPPGFASHERVEQNFASLSGNQLLDTVLRNQYQNPPAGYMADNDGFELTDPAILAVGKEKIPSGNNFPGMDLGQNFPPQLSTFDNEARLQLLMQRSLPPHPNQRLADTGDNFSSFHDAYGIPSRAGEQTLGSNLPQFSQFSLPQSRNSVMSNGHWDVWNGVNSGNDLGMAELFRTERVGGLNNFYSGYDESKFRAPNSGSFYNRTFGI